MIHDDAHVQPAPRPTRPVQTDECCAAKKEQLHRAPLSRVPHDVHSRIGLQYM